MHHCNSPLLTTAALGLLLAGCSVSYSVQDSVEIPGNQATDQKLQLAQEIAAAVWTSGLPMRLHERFPALTEESLQGLGVRWNVMKSVALNGGSGSDVHVAIQCTFSYRDDLSSVAKQIVQACKEEVQGAIAKRLATPKA